MTLYDFESKLIKAMKNKFNIMNANDINEDVSINFNLSYLFVNINK
jgi:hypothetical protein